MSFLRQTNDDFIKVQLRSLLVDPDKKKELKKKLGKLGLYSNRNGFGTYRDFFTTELGSTAKSRRGRRLSSQIALEKPEITKKTTKSELPSFASMKPARIRGFFSTEFFKRSKIAISACVLYTLINKINVPNTPQNFSVKLPSRYDKNFDLKFIPYYISSFLCVAENLPKVLVGNIIPLAPEIKKSISNTYIGVCSVYGVNRKVYMRNKDTRLIMYLCLKPWPGIITEPLNKFFFKKYPLLNELSFEDFVGNYIFTHNVHNQKRLCFDIYDKLNLQYVTSKHIFAFFESPIFPLIKNDLFVMINYLSNDRYIEETAKLSRTNTRIIQSEIFKIISSEPKRLNFKTFCKLNFEQRFPDMLLAVAHAFFDEIGSNFLTRYYSIPTYKVHIRENLISVSRPINICKNYLKIVENYNKLIRNEVKAYQSSHSYLNKDIIKGCITVFMLACNIEYLCKFKQLEATVNSFREGSEVVFDKACPLIMERIFSHIAFPGIFQINLWEFLDYIGGFFSVRAI